MNQKSNSGCYILIIPANESSTLEIGALGTIRFCEGHYVYVGRAIRNLMQRVERHFRHEKKLRWHIDYFLKRYTVDAAYVTSSLDECTIAQNIAGEKSAEVIDRFGASDCKCQGHLVYFESGIHEFRKKIAGRGFRKVDITR